MKKNKFKEKLRFLILEDMPSDADLMLDELEKTKLNFTCQIAEDKKSFLKLFKEFQPDLILSDYSLPSFTALEAMRIANNKTPQVPVIIVTGSIDEETAVKCMKEGASDYILKSNLQFLSVSVNTVLGQRQLKIDKEEAQAALLKSERLLKKSQEIAHIGSWMYDSEIDEITWSEEIPRIFGVENIRKTNYEGFIEYVHPDDREIVNKAHQHAAKFDESLDLVLRIVRPNGEERIVELKSENIINEKGESSQTVGIIHDITERKIAEEELRKKLLELNNFNKFFVERENKMIALKAEINDLRRKLGLSEKYNEY